MSHLLYFPEKSRRIIYLSKRFASGLQEKAENSNVVYKLPEILKKIEDNSAERLNFISKQFEYKIDGIKSGMEGKLDGLSHKIDGIKTGMEAKLDGIKTGMEGKLDGLSHKIDGIKTGMEGKLDGLSQKIGVYGGIFGLIFGIMVKIVYDNSTRSKNEKP